MNTIMKSLACLTVTMGMMVGMSTAQAADKPVLNMCTGADGGSYYVTSNNAVSYIKSFDRKDQFDIELIDTTGSLEEVEMMQNAECDVILIQGDISDYEHDSGTLPSNNRIIPAYTETIIYLANTAHGKTDLEDIEGSDEYLIVVADGSGAYGTMRNFAKEDKGYDKNFKGMIMAFDAADAANIAASGVFNGKKVAGALLVTTPKSKTLKQISELYGEKLTIGNMGDKDFNDAQNSLGQDLYTDFEFPASKFAFLKHDTMGWNQNTLGVKAVFEFNVDSFVEKFENSRHGKKAASAVLQGLSQAVVGME